ncbi:MAG: NAD-dependent epimerase/dehydratase family protein, partial [Promethearchaeota archaeon]
KELKNYFLNAGFQVFGTTYFRPPIDEREIQFDIRKKENFYGLWDDENFDTVIHTIGLMDQSEPYTSMYAINAQGTRYMCEYAKSRGCKHLIFTSSVSLYGTKTIGENRTESETKRQDKHFVTPYGKSKAIAEQFIEASGLNYTNLRLPIVLGRGDTFISPSIIPRLVNHKFFTCGKKPRKISLLYVKNLAPLIERLINVGPLNKSLNCISHTILWEDLVKEYATDLAIEYNPKIKSKLTIFTNFKNRDYQFIASYSAFGAHYLSNNLSKVLDNWKPPYDWKDGVKEAIEGFFERNN